MSTADGAITIVFNGEIYNFLELRRQLQALGHAFRSTGDTEVLLTAYRQWGPKCVARFNGMWAFLIYDRREQIIFGSRDRFGIKPLYMYRDVDCVLFASEIKGICASGLYKAEPNWNVAASYLVDDRLDETMETFYRGIQQIPSGSAFELDLLGGFKQWKYWELSATVTPPPSDPAAAFAELFEDAVQVHMRSDVPVGVNLSGGLDSTSIICASARTRAAAGAAGPLMAFSYMPSEFDESDYIADTVRQSGARLIRLETSPRKLWDDLPAVLWYHDEPVHSMTAVVGFQLMALAAKHGMKVLLNGQGADETIGGYPSFFKSYWHTVLIERGLEHLWSEVNWYTRLQRGNPRNIFAGQIGHWILTRLKGLSSYRNLAHRLRRKQIASNRWFTRSLVEVIPARREVTQWNLKATLARAIEEEPLPLFLRVEDRNSMAHSIEARVPFLDYRLVELAFSLPVDWNMRGPWNKFVLREAMRGRIPESVRTRVDKMGFPTPSKKWFAETLFDPVCDMLCGRRARERGIYNIENVMKDLQRHRNGEADISGILFPIVQFELWNDLVEGIAPA